MKPKILLILALTAAFPGCTKYASIAERRAEFRPARAMVGPLESVQGRINRAADRERREPLLALGEYLEAAETASQQLARNPQDTAARDAYNFAVARVLGMIKSAKLDPWSHPLRVPSQGGDFVLTRKPDPRKAWNPALYDFTPADQFDVMAAA